MKSERCQTGERVGRTGKLISKYCCGKAELPIQVAEKVIECFPAVRIEWLFGIDDFMTEKERLGHAQVSTTANIYAHVMKDADKRNVDLLSDLFLKKEEIFKES